MATVTLRNLGGSIVMSVPKKILSLIELDAGSKVDVSVESGRLIVTPRKTPRYTLAQLLSGTKKTDLSAKRGDRAWLQSGPTGREAL